MAKIKSSRKDLLKKPDEFITVSARVINFTIEHSRQFRYLGIGLACLLLIFLGINTYLRYMDKKGQSAYNMAYYSMAKNSALGQDEDNLKKSEDLFNTVIDKYGISKAAQLALPEVAYLKFRQKKYDEAIYRYQEFLNKASDDPYKSLARIALAVCYEEKGEFENAIKTLERVRSGPDDFFKEQALLSLARIYRLTDKKEKSNEILKEFIDKFETSPFLSIAKAYLKQ